MRLPTLDEIDRELARRSLYEFLVQAWPHIEPRTPLVLNWHIETLCNEVQAVLDGRSEKRRLALNVPPGSMKFRGDSHWWPRPFEADPRGSSRLAPHHRKGDA